MRAWLATLPLSAACYWISSLYSLLVPSKRRLDLAMYFTPPQLGSHVVRMISRISCDFATARIIDPACGGAAFLLPAAILLRRLLLRRGFTAAEVLQHIEAHIVGWERDSVLAYISRTFLCLALDGEIQVSGRTLNPKVEVVDSLVRIERDRAHGYDVVLCNPPYRKITASELPGFRRRYPNLIAGQPNLYAIFSAVSLSLARPGGVVALLTPTSFVSGDTFEPLRKYLLTNSRMRLLEMIHEREGVFHDVEQDAALAIYERRVSPPLHHQPLVSSWNLRGVRQHLGQLKLNSSGAPWRIPRVKNHRELLRSLEKSPWRLEHYGYRATVGAYVWNRDQREHFSVYPRGALRAKTFPIIWASYARKGFSFSPRSEKELSRKYLVLKGDRDNGGIRRRPSVLVQRTSSRAQSRRLVAAVLPQKFIDRFGGFIAENHVIVLEPTCKRPRVSLANLCRVLTCQIVQDAYSMASGTSTSTVGGLSSLPLPHPDVLLKKARSKDDFENVVRLGYMITESCKSCEGLQDALTTATTQATF